VQCSSDRVHKGASHRVHKGASHRVHPEPDPTEISEEFCTQTPNRTAPQVRSGAVRVRTPTRTGPRHPYTNWRTKDRHHQQATIAARHHNHLLPREPRTGIISRLQLQQSITATHCLKSQGKAPSAGHNCSEAPQPLTNWRAKDRHDHQARIAAKHHNHSLSGDPKTGIISRLELQQGITATHFLENQ
jgi:hypothetical protein